MPLDDVLDYLKKYPTKWFTTTDISKGIDLSNSSCTRLLGKLFYRKHIIKKLDMDHRIKYGRRLIWYWRYK